MAIVQNPGGGWKHAEEPLKLTIQQRGWQVEN